jgi:hypothetical protein
MKLRFVENITLRGRLSRPCSFATTVIGSSCAGLSEVVVAPSVASVWPDGTMTLSAGGEEGKDRLAMSGDGGDRAVSRGRHLTVGLCEFGGHARVAGAEMTGW